GLGADGSTSANGRRAEIDRPTRRDRAQPIRRRPGFPEWSVDRRDRWHADGRHASTPVPFLERCSHTREAPAAGRAAARWPVAHVLPPTSTLADRAPYLPQRG